MSHLGTRFAALVSALGLLAACATLPSGPPVPAPALAVGDHWLYRITDNLRRGLVTMLDAEVVSTSAGVATVRLVFSNEFGREEKSEEIGANGGLVVGTLREEPTRHFPQPIELYRFPLQGGVTWRQVVNTISPETQLPAQILVFGTVQGQTVVTVPAGTFDTMFVYRILQLDDEQFWRTRTTRNDSVWFSPDVKGPVREIRDASYLLRDGRNSPLVRTENTTRELISFQPGGK
jgi:hypothetical protein